MLSLCQTADTNQKMCSDSDSDSDYCDFSTDINKKITKSLNTFWDNYKLNTNTGQNDLDAEDIYSDLSTFDDSIKDVCVKKTSTALDPVVEKCETITALGPIDHNVEEIETAASCSTSLDKSCQNTPDIIEINMLDTNVNSRIANKLDKLSETINDILSDTGKHKKTWRKRLPKSVKVAHCRASAKRKNKKPNVKIEKIDVSDGECEAEKVLIGDMEELNPSVTIKVLWKFIDTKLFKVKKFQVLDCIYDYYIKETNVNPKLLYFTIDDKEINLQENSYVSLRLNDDKFIEGSTLPESYIDKPKFNLLTERNGTLTLKVQCSGLRSKQFVVHCLKNDKLEVVMWQVIRHVDEVIENIKLLFDGEIVKPNDTLEKLGIEEDDCFDLIILNWI